MTINAWLSQTTAVFKAVGIPSARLDALVLLEHLLQRDRSWLLAHLHKPMSLGSVKISKPLVERRRKREPLAYVIGQKEFYGLNFIVTPDVLIPRPETESLVETAVTIAPNQARVLDLGTGCGSIAVALKTHRPDLELCAIDISSAALEIAKKNAFKNRVSINFIASDLFSRIPLVNSDHSQFDVILANLPYVPIGTRHEPELQFEPTLALYAGTDGLDIYRRLLDEAPNYLALNGQLLIEASPTQHASLTKMTEQKWEIRNVTEYIYQLSLQTLGRGF